MPYKSEKIKIAGTRFDNRRRLSLDQVRAIKFLKENGYSYRQLATMFGCSKWAIQNIIHPPTKAKAKKRPTAYWTEKKRQYRQRKQALYKLGALKENNRHKH